MSWLAAAVLTFLYLTCTAPPRLLLSRLEALIALHTPNDTEVAAGSHKELAEGGAPEASKALAQAAAKLFLSALLRYIRHKMVRRTCGFIRCFCVTVLGGGGAAAVSQVRI